jgi:hypothetical protein
MGEAGLALESFCPSNQIKGPYALSVRLREGRMVKPEFYKTNPISPSDGKGAGSGSAHFGGIGSGPAA